MDIPTLPLLAPIRERWSPRAFLPLAISHIELATLFEAARWAASSFNEQPWRFIVATRDEPGFQVLADCLLEANHWAMEAPVLFLTVAHHTFTRDGADNHHAWHDVGLAMGNLSIQAAAMDLQLHQMAGFVPERARDAFAIPRDFDPVAIVALGRPGEALQLADKLRAIELAPRTRRHLNELVFAESFGHPAPCTAAATG